MGTSGFSRIFRPALILIFLFISSCGPTHASPTPTATSSAPTIPAETTTPTQLLPVQDTVQAVLITPAVVEITPTGLTHPWSEVLNPILDQGGQWHVLVRGPDGNTLYQRGAEDVTHPASVIKLAIGMLVFSWLEDEYGDLEKILPQGPLHAGRSYEQLLKAMMVYSEEDATEKLQNALVEGYGWKKINQHLAEWGAPHTTLTPRRMTPADMINLLVDVNERDLPSRAASQKILEFLSEVTKGDTVRLWKLKNVLPAGSTIFDKRGSLTDPLIVADAGIIRLPDGISYYLCLFGYPDGKTTFEDLDRMIGDFAVAWYWELSRLQ